MLGLKKYKYKINLKDRQMIEPDEIFLDSKNPMGFSKETLEGVLEFPIKSRYFFIEFAVGILILTIFAARLFFLSIIKGEYFWKISESNHSSRELIAPERGIIYDRDFELLVANVPRFSLILKNGAMLDDEEILDLAKKLSPLIQADVAEISDIFKEAIAGLASQKSDIVIFPNVDPEKALILKSVLEKDGQLTLASQKGRNYIDGEIFSHIIGYLGKIGRELADKNDYSYNDLIGKAGLELLFEPLLRGRAGELKREFDARGNLVAERIVKQPFNGQNLVLSINAGLQRKMKESLAARLERRGSRAGAAVAMDPRNGEILGLVSLPGFDNNLFLKTSSKDLKKILSDSQKPLFNRAVAGEYPPGSTIKPLMATAALEEKIIDPAFQVFDPGYISVPSLYDASIIYTFKDWKYFGNVNMKRAIAESANVYFYTIGGGYEGFKGLGIEKIKTYFKKFGLGNLFGIDLNGEKSGLVPDPDWKLNVKKELWFIGDTYNVSIGQGDLRVTPLQLASAYAALANGGKLFKPRILREIVDGDKNIIQKFEPEILNESIASSENIETVREGMRETVRSGSATSLYSLPVQVAGKTGTAQFGNGKKHAWFGSFAPYQNPEIVLIVLVEEGEGGSVDAVPVAKDILTWYFSKK
ncbi:MAG: penicillin-binding protein 2 [Parcubacteria group bacterium]|nr:penicillin-binding protein 2 [Parcubacteria group bacterium]